MKPATNRLAGRVVEIERRADLLDDAVMHHHDLVGHGHGLDLVVRDVDGRGLEPLVQFLDLGAHLRRAAWRRGWTAARRTGTPADRARWRGPWRRAGAGRRRAGADSGRAAASRSRMSAARLHPFDDLGSWRAAQLEREAHVVGDRHVRIERVVLEHHRDVALFRRDVVDDAIADRDVRRGDLFQPGDHAQQGRLAAARRADQHDELAILDRNRHAVQNFGPAERLSHVANLYRRHRLSPHFLHCGATGGRRRPAVFSTVNAGSRIQPSSSSAVSAFCSINGSAVNNCSNV